MRVDTNTGYLFLKIAMKMLFSMSAINISCYEELSMLFQLVFLKYAMLWPEFAFLHLSASDKFLIKKINTSKYSTIFRIWNQNTFVIHIPFRSL